MTDNNAIARVYDREDGEHVADLHDEDRVAEFRESGAWRVELSENDGEGDS